MRIAKDGYTSTSYVYLGHLEYDLSFVDFFTDVES